MITLAVLVTFSLVFLEETFCGNYAASFDCIVAALSFAFRF